LLLAFASACATEGANANGSTSNEGQAATDAGLVAATALAATPPEQPTSPEPGLRLSTDVQPSLIRVKLSIKPDADTAQGVVDLDVKLNVPLQTVWLNAGEMKFGAGEAVLNGEHWPAKVSSTSEHVALTFAKPLPAGAATLHLEYTAQVSPKDNDGLFREHSGDDNYVFTHFEPFHARRAFPCFDEPSFKPAWQMTVRVPQGNLAFNNAPLEKRTPNADGTETFEFAATPPLPSYLVAVAAGPLVRVDAGKAGKNGVPLGVIVPRGLEGQARYPAQSAGKLIDILEDYFGMPYPYAKLDLVSIPLYGGATENPGLIVFVQSLMCSRPEDETINFRRNSANVMAHEFSHLWFGDLVTNAWWDDIWLNEAFATWMTPKVIERFEPSWGAPEDRVLTRGGAMGADSLLSARQIRQPIATRDDIKNSFDGITYSKGAAVIDMFERYVTPAKFREGVQHYLAAHANGNATAKDFLGAIGDASGVDVGTPFSTFLDQAGVPLLTVSLACEKGKPPRLDLSQQRYLPLGAEPSASVAQQVWQVPVCARWIAKGKEGRDCTLLTSAQGSLPLSSATCPEWVLPNEGTSGYFRTRFQGDMLEKLLAHGGKKLTVPERLGVLSDANALTSAGLLPLGDLLKWVPELARDDNRHVVESTLGIAGYLHEDDLVPASLQKNYARFLQQTYGARLKALGWDAKPDDSEDAKLLRSKLLSVLGTSGDDPAVQKEARKRADSWLADRHSVNPELVGVALAISAMHGDGALYDRWHAAAKAEKDQRDRMKLLTAMGAFRDAKVVEQGLPLMLSDEFETRESLRLIGGATNEPETRQAAWAFIKNHFDVLVAKLPRDYGAYLPGIASSICDDSQRAEVEAFFQDRCKQFAGGPRQLAQALEHMHLCSVFREKQASSVEAFLKAH
jgi:alanyl aminopeptidase